MSISFATIGPKKSQNTQDLSDVIQNIGHTNTLYSINDITINTNSLNKNSFFDHDIYLFRGYNKSVSYAHALASLLQKNNKIVIDTLLTKTIVHNKFEESILLTSHNIPHPITYYTQNQSSWIEILNDIKLPVIVKSLDGQQGQDIYKLNSSTEIIDFFTKHPKGFLAQQYIKSDGDIRVFIVNNKILGAIKRSTIANDFRSNASLGAKTTPHNLTKIEKEIALSAHKCIGYDISGVDIILDNKNNPFILEVNHTPQWQAFKKTLNINPAEEIINYSIQKYEEKNRVL